MDKDLVRSDFNDIGTTLQSLRTFVDNMKTHVCDTSSNDDVVVDIQIDDEIIEVYLENRVIDIPKKLLLKTLKELLFDIPEEKKDEKN